jgi:ribosomal protein L11 methylase PrmA
MKIEITVEGPRFAILMLHEALERFSPVVDQDDGREGHRARVRLFETTDSVDERLLELSSMMSRLKKSLALTEDLEIRVRNLAYCEPPGASERPREPFKPVPGITIQPWCSGLSRNADASTIFLHHKQAFGTGRHPSTRLCLESISRLARGERAPWKLRGRSVLDFGCGTGLLAVAAVKMGAACALGVEIDKEAADTAQMNVALNGLSEKIVIRRGSWEGVRGEYDVILANVVASVLIRTGGEIAKHLKEAGMAVISGFGINQAGDMVQFFQSLGLETAERPSLDGWAALVMKKGVG